MRMGSLTDSTAKTTTGSRMAGHLLVQTLIMAGAVPLWWIGRGCSSNKTKLAAAKAEDDITLCWVFGYDKPGHI